MLIGNTGLPSGSVFQNAVDSPDTFNIPGLPAPYFVSATAIDGLYFSWYCSPTPLSQSQVESDVTAVIKKLRETTGSSTTTDPNYLAFRDALPFKMIVSADALKAGFYDKLDSRKYPTVSYTSTSLLSTANAYRFDSPGIPQHLVYRRCLHFARLVCPLELHPGRHTSQGACLSTYNDLARSSVSRVKCAVHKLI